MLLTIIIKVCRAIAEREVVQDFHWKVSIDCNLSGRRLSFRGIPSCLTPLEIDFLREY